MRGRILTTLRSHLKREADDHSCNCTYTIGVHVHVRTQKNRATLSELASELVARDALIFAEVELGYRFAGNGITDELFATLRAKIKPQLLVDLATDRFALGIIHLFQDILDLYKMVSVIIAFIRIVDFRRCVYFHANDVSQRVIGVNKAFASVARMMNHDEFVPSSILNSIPCPVCDGDIIDSRFPRDRSLHPTDHDHALTTQIVQIYSFFIIS